VPTVTTSQHPLPPIKKLTPYVKIDYAEIMHSERQGNALLAPNAIASKRWEENRKAKMQVG